jgi:peptide deformylase
MARLTILEYPDERLRTVAKPVTAFDAALGQFCDDLLATMYAAQGIGLAATQVNVHWQVIAVDVSQAANQPLVLINPHIETRDKIGRVEEGCLSLPGVYADVERATQIQVRALDRAGNPCEYELEGMAAVCVQHEMDHLQGKLFVDHLSFFGRRRAIKKLTSLRREQAAS